VRLWVGSGPNVCRGQWADLIRDSQLCLWNGHCIARYNIYISNKRLLIYILVIKGVVLHEPNTRRLCPNPPRASAAHFRLALISMSNSITLCVRTYIYFGHSPTQSTNKATPPSAIRPLLRAIKRQSRDRAHAPCPATKAQSHQTPTRSPAPILLKSIVA
jgi:hypothetical protein